MAFCEWFLDSIQEDPTLLDRCDSSLCGIMKDHVYAQSPRDVNHLKSLIKHEFIFLNDDINLCKAFVGLLLWII